MLQSILIMVTTIDRETNEKDKDGGIYEVTRIYILDDKSESLTTGVISDVILLTDFGALLNKIRSTGARIEVKITSI